MPVAVVLVLGVAADVVPGADVLGAVDGVVVEDGDGGFEDGARLGAGGLAARPVPVVQAGALKGACQGCDSIDILKGTSSNLSLIMFGVSCKTYQNFFFHSHEVSPNSSLNPKFQMSVEWPP